MRSIKLETIVGLFMILSILIFLFMSFKIGIWRVDTVRYAHYIVYFDDVSGLNEKSDILIAGVKVGWVQKLSLVSRNKHVRVDLMLDRSSIIYSNATALIRQNGLLGTKYIDLIPGDPTYPILPAESTFMNPTKSTVSIDELLRIIKDIADNIHEVSGSLKNTFSNDEHGKNLTNLVKNAQNAFGEIEKTAQSLSNLVSHNSNNINSLTANLNVLIEEMKSKLPNGIDTISQSSKSISDSIRGASSSLDSTLVPIKNVFTNVEQGKGIMGTLFTDDSVAKEVRETITNIKDYFSYLERISVDLDVHLESMQSKGNDLDFKDAKGYFNLHIRPAFDFYYIAGLTSSYYGTIKRYRTDSKWYAQDKHEIIPKDLVLDDWAKLWFAPVQEQYIREYDAITFNLQFAKEFGKLQLRAGLFESTFGFGLDYNIIFNNNVSWITSVEVFKWNEFLPVTLSGRLVYDIDMPNLKWYNRVFFNDSIYCIFGVDDILGKYNTSFFAGLGIYFEQDDLKYLSSSMKLK